MDGVPIFNLVRETLPAVEIAGFRGVVNSTTNHILSALETARATKRAAAMQDLGIRGSGPLARRRTAGTRGEDRGAGQRPDAGRG
jgi:homoserine dehydrogenase